MNTKLHQKLNFMHRKNNINKTDVKNTGAKVTKGELDDEATQY